MADEPTDHTLALLRRLDAKLDRLQSGLDDHTGRLQRLEQRSGLVERRAGGGVGPASGPSLERVMLRLDEIERRLRRLEDHSL